MTGIAAAEHAWAVLGVVRSQKELGPLERGEISALFAVLP